MNNILKEKIAEKSLIGIRTINQEWDEVIIGFPKLLHGDNILIDEIDKYGESLGQTTIKIAEILSIEYDDPYQKRLKSIVESAVSFNDKLKVTIWNKKDDLMIIMNELIRSGDITTLFFDEDFFVTGKIIDFSNDFVKINNISSSGENEGFSVHLSEKLIGIRYNGKEELKINFFLVNNGQ